MVESLMKRFDTSGKKTLDGKDFFECPVLHSLSFQENCISPSMVLELPSPKTLRVVTEMAANVAVLSATPLLIRFTGHSIQREIHKSYLLQMYILTFRTFTTQL